MDIKKLSADFCDRFLYGRLMHSREISLDDARGIIDGLLAVSSSAKLRYNDGSGEYIEVSGHTGFQFLEKDYLGVRGKKTLNHQLRIKGHSLQGVINFRTESFDSNLRYSHKFS